MCDFLLRMKRLLLWKLEYLYKWERDDIRLRNIDFSKLDGPCGRCFCLKMNAVSHPQLIVLRIWENFVSFAFYYCASTIGLITSCAVVKHDIRASLFLIDWSHMHRAHDHFEVSVQTLANYMIEFSNSRLDEFG